ncbi:hypothetical protein QE152_g24380 [Popillia japonica]|uniref:Uncharacterized protein n=1 Tax=Popillia japonica TaxID=7064 RepID=A0AAW1KG87_POPJA
MCDKSEKWAGAAGGGAISVGYIPPNGKIVDADMHDADLENDIEGLKRIVQGVTKRTLDGKKEGNKEKHLSIEVLEEKLREREKRIEFLQ